MKASLRLFILSLLTLGLVACNSAQTGLVDPNLLFQNSASGKAGIAHLQAIEASLQEQLVIAQKYIEEQPSNMELQAFLQGIFQNYQEIIGQKQQAVLDGINAQMIEAMGAVRKKRGYKIIMSTDSALSFDETINLTKDVLTEMDAKPLTFEPFVLTPISLPENLQMKKEEKATEKKEEEKK